MSQLSEPFEILELPTDGTLSFHVTQIEEGEISFNPRHQPEGKTVNGVRLWVQKADKPQGMPYYDVTGKHLAAQLKGLHSSGGLLGRRITLTKRGVGAQGRYQLDVSQ